MGSKMRGATDSPTESDMTDPDKAASLSNERLEGQSHEERLRARDVSVRHLNLALFGWRGRLGLRTHYQWLAAPCESRPEHAAMLAEMISRHPAPEKGWLVRTPYSTVLVPGHHKRIPKGAEKVEVVRAGLFPLGQRWQPFEDWFALDAEGVVWANDMGSRALELMNEDVTVARYAAEVLVAARVIAKAHVGSPTDSLRRSPVLRTNTAQTCRSGATISGGAAGA